VTQTGPPRRPGAGRTEPSLFSQNTNAGVSKSFEAGTRPGPSRTLPRCLTPCQDARAKSLRSGSCYATCGSI
jgi:hypothetical protein